MSAASDYLETETLNFWFRNNAGSVSAPATVYVALYTADTAGETSSPGTEVSGGGYARVAVTFGAPSANSGAMRIANTGTVQFAQASTDLGTVTHWAILDASTSGNVLISPQAFSSSFDYDTGVQPEFDVGALTVDLA